jgi:hypothetical protein
VRRNLNLSLQLICTILVISSCQSQLDEPTEEVSIKLPTVTPTELPTEILPEEVEVQPTDTPVVTEQPDRTLDDPQAALMHALDDLKNNSFQALAIISGNDEPFEYQVEYVPPDRYSYSGPIGELIIIGEDSYLNIGGTWSAPIIDEASLLKGFLSYADTEKISNAQYLGEEILDGEPADVITYQTEIDFNGSPVISTSKIWIAVESGLAIKVEAHSETGTNDTFTTIVYTYDPSLEINAPIP